MANSSGSVSYEVKFVIPSGKSQNDSTDILKLAFETMDCNGLEPMWIKEEECLKIQEKVSKLFICDPFEGPAFEHLTSLNCRVMGPLCILMCLSQGETLPKRAHPVYSLTMRKISVTCSNVNKQMREDISRKVLLMGGLFSKDLTKSVTHLIVGEVGSKKYHVAANFSIPIMLPEWVEECWNTEQYSQKLATDPIFDKFRCPVFKGLTITVSQLSSEERKTAQELIEKNGGQYSGILKAKETTHLVLTEPIGEKYKFARAWKLFCVKVEWLYDSLNAGHCMNEMLYQLEKRCVEHGHSTPKKDNEDDNDNKKKGPAPDCSIINNVSILSRLDETAQSDVTIVSIKRQSDKLLQMDILNSLDISKLSKTSQFLDGCRILLSGFHGPHLDKLRKIISAGGGARFSKLGESVTHVILGERDPELIKDIVDSCVRPHVVSYHWLVDCCKQQKLLDENPYTCLQNIPLSPVVRNQKHFSSQLPSVKSISQHNETTAEKEDFSDIMKQYLPVDENECKASAFNSEVKKNSGQNNEVLQTVTEGINEGMKDGGKDQSYEANSADKIFINLTFMIFGFGPKDLELLTEMIEAGSGTTLNSSVDRCADVGIVPITGCEVNGTVKEVVTNCWLQMCTESEMLLPFDANMLFKPIYVKPNCQPLSGCVLTFSQYTGTERDCLMHLAEVLGAQCQEYFVHKGNKSRRLLPNTHLIVFSAEGSKYEASKKWKIPAVTKFWLFAAAKTGIKPNEEKFAVENSNESENNFKMDDAINGVGLCMQSKPVNSNVVEHSNYDLKCSESNSKITNKNGEEFRMEESAVAQNQHIKELIESEQPANFQKSINGNSETPNKFLNLDSEYHPNYDVNDLLASLDSSGSQVYQGMNNRKRKSSLPLEELFSHNMEVALKKFGPDDSAFQLSGREEINEQHYSCKQFNRSNLDSNLPSTSCASGVISKPRPLSGVVIYVSKKLNSKQGELNNIVGSLGGDYKWTYDSSCTHFIFQGRVNDITREFRIAREHGKKIVSPEWIYSCRDANAWVDESLYPHNHNPRMSLSGQISSKRVPVENVHLEKSADGLLENDDVVSSCLHYKNTDRENNSSEGRTDVSKQLEEFLTAAKCVKTSKRWSRRLNSSGSTSPVAGESSRSKGLNISKVQTSESNPLGKDKALPPQPESLPTEASQSIPIIWDDPTDRLEREKIAEQLARGTDTQDTQSPDQVPCDIELQQVQTSGNKNSEYVEEAVVEIHLPQKFMLSGLSEKEKENCITIIEDLGGTVSDEKSFDMTATHLILGQPLKNEKYLAAVASGIWVLHRSYLEACKEAGQFVEEESHEWGGPATHQILEKLPEKLTKVALCPHRWRINVEQGKSKKGAFQDWKVIVIAEKQKAATYSRILTAGGAELLSVEPPYSECQQATHAFIELSKSALAKVNFASLVSNGVSCLKPEYLAFYLVEDPPPPEKDYTIPQAVKLLQNSANEEQCKSKPNANSLRTGVSTKRYRQT